MDQPEFFSNVIEDETLYFDDGGPVVIKTAGSLSSSIDTTAFDAYRQGVEITTERHYTLGLAKIHSGEPGHALLRATLGSDTQASRTKPYEDPRSIGDEVDTSELLLNGVLEPFSLRQASNDDPHTIRAATQDGNSNRVGASDCTVSTRSFSEEPTFVPFVDKFASKFTTLNDGTTMFKIDLTDHEALVFVDGTVSSFNDELDIPISSVTSQPTLQTYVTYHATASIDNVNAQCGFVYDNVLGTDSLAFGGMTWR